MKERLNWQVTLGLIFISLSAAVYYIHYLIFRDAHHIFLYLVGDIAFVFLEVFMVTLVIHSLLTVREKRALLKKLNMVIGTFFSQAGTDLMRYFSRLDRGSSIIAEKLVVDKSWTDQEFINMQKELKGYRSDIDCKTQDLENLKSFLASRRDFLLVLLENPNLLEHESFTNLLWAVFHLGEELSRRESLQASPASDLEHLKGDIKRVYDLIIVEWLSYMRHLKNDYPYLFSLAMRTNPFDPNASILVR